MSDFLDVKCREIDERLKELQPLVQEYHRLEAAAAALGGIGVDGGGARSTRKAPGRPRKASVPGAKRGRPKGSGSRSKEALALIVARPGITVPEMAETMGIKQNYLYRVVPDMAKEGLVRKDGRGWHAVVAA